MLFLDIWRKNSQNMQQYKLLMYKSVNKGQIVVIMLRFVA